MSNFETRYSYGGDEFIFVELSQEMSIERNVKALAMARKLESKKIDGIIDICPCNVSLLIRFNPDVVEGSKLIKELKVIEKSVGKLDNFEIQSRLIDVPVLFEDPWTHEVTMRFRDCHQDPNSTDVEFCAKYCGYKSKQDFIEAITHAPYIVSMVGFIPGVAFNFQIVPREKAIQVPKYLRPRTETPERCLSIGGAFACIDPVEEPGGYQMLGIAAAPVFDKDQKLPDFKDSIEFFVQGDILRFRRIERDEYDSIRHRVEEGTFEYRKKDFRFTPEEIVEDPEKFSEMAVGRLYND